MVTGIGLRFLHFGYSERTAVKKVAYLIGVSGLEGI